jgi:MFS family permease
VKHHSLITSLRRLTGNPRGCVYTEPLWGIPFNLYAPYVSIYMLALGLSDADIGLTVSISWGFQVIFALLSGIITDKMGRRKTTLIYDVLAWAVPALISAVAQNIWYLLAAGIVNSTWRIVMNSWTCLLVEDAEQEQLVDIFTWISISNQLVGLIAPLAGIMIGVFSLVPTMRGLYLFAFVMFTLKPIVTYVMTEETAQGILRMSETRSQTVLDMLRGYTGVVRDLLRAPQTLYMIAITLVVSITTLISGSFWAIIVTQKLHIPAQHLGAFPFVKSAIILGFFFLVMPKIAKMHYKLPLTLGFLGFVASQVLLITAPDQGYLVLLASAFLEACSFAVVNPLVGEMTALTIDAQERARIQSILYVLIILFTSPFGWVAGTLSSFNKDAPFILNIGLYIAGAVLAYLAGQVSQKQLAATAAAV